MREDTQKLVTSVFTLLDVKTFFELSEAYAKEDQKLMKGREWDATNPALITNKVKLLLEQISSEDLDVADKEWWAEILWFWYHHAVSCTSWANNRPLVQIFATKALALQEVCQPEGLGQPNRITRLLWLLAYDKVDEAKVWMSQKPDGADAEEHETGLEIIREYEKGVFG